MKNIFLPSGIRIRLVIKGLSKNSIQRENSILKLPDLRRKKDADISEVIQTYSKNSSQKNPKKIINTRHLQLLISAGTMKYVFGTKLNFTLYVSPFLFSAAVHLFAWRPGLWLKFHPLLPLLHQKAF